MVVEASMEEKSWSRGLCGFYDGMDLIRRRDGEILGHKETDLRENARQQGSKEVHVCVN